MTLMMIDVHRPVLSMMLVRIPGYYCSDALLLKMLMKTMKILAEPTAIRRKN